MTATHEAVTHETADGNQRTFVSPSRFPTDVKTRLRKIFAGIASFVEVSAKPTENGLSYAFRWISTEQGFFCELPSDVDYSGRVYKNAVETMVAALILAKPDYKVKK